MLSLCFFVLLFILSLVKSDSVPVGPYLWYKDLNGKPYTVTSDERSFIINGTRTLLLGGSIHYPRMSVWQWNDILNKMKKDGLNHAEVYVFWNIHEPYYVIGTNHHQYNYSGRANLTNFLEIAKNVGMFINLRIGPYVCAEYFWGGLPTWLLYDKNIQMRWNNTEWEGYMKGFMQEIVRIATPYLASNGGPIILAQIENEYKNNLNPTYINWCGQVVKELNIGIPWVMCNGASASDTINTCNGNDCYNKYAKSHSSHFPGQPLAWTEDEGWYNYWGSAYDASKQYDPNVSGYANRSPQEMAFVISKWFGAGGSHHNYYMYYGGNHIGNTAGSSIANWYADGVNYHSDGLPHEPKRSHLNGLHYLLADYQEILLSDSIQIGKEIVINNNQNTFAYVYKMGNKNITFLYNLENKNVTLRWKQHQYSLPNDSVSIIDTVGTEIYNSAKINMTGLATKRIFKTIYSGASLRWSSWTEDNTKRTDKSIMNTTPLEQIKLSNNTLEQMYYSTQFTLSSSYSSKEIELKFIGYTSCRYMVFINDIYIDSKWDYTHDSYAVNYTFTINTTITSGKQYILKILSSSQGMDNRNGRGVATGMGPDAQDKKGLIASVILLNHENKLIMDLTKNNWSHLIGLSGESLNIAINTNMVTWQSPADNDNTLTWYKTSFKTPIYNDSNVLLIDIGDNTGNGNKKGLMRGRFYMNGIDLGHYNNINQQNNVMVQRYYFIPPDMLINNGDMMNTLIFFEEMNGCNTNMVDIVLSMFVIPP